MRGNFITNRKGSMNPNYKDGRSNSRLYSIYRGMLTRCYNVESPQYQRYGKRGISICDEWKNDFQAFQNWSMAHGYAEDLTIDRINNDGNYEPDNCRWVTRKIQSNNTSRCHYITIDGETKSLRDWCDHYAINYNLVRDRLNRNWNPEDAFVVPPDVRFRKKVITC